MRKITVKSESGKTLVEIPLVLGVAGALFVGPWTAVLLWPGAAPVWLVVLMAFTTATGGPASMVGFDLARTSNPAERLASANGIINQAGFSASLVVVVATCQWLAGRGWRRG